MDQGGYGDGPDERWERIRGKDGQPISDPVLLDENGQPYTTGSTVAIVIYKHPYADFNAIGI
jgi:hypothetical protein